MRNSNISYKRQPVSQVQACSEADRIRRLREMLHMKHFAERQKFVHQVLVDIRMAVPVEHRRLRSTRDALQLLRDVQRAGGEGVIARHPGNCYRPGRTRQILKLKSDLRGAAHSAQIDPSGHRVN